MAACPEVRWLDFLDDAPGIGQPLCGLFDRRNHAGVGVIGCMPLEHRHAQLLGVVRVVQRCGHPLRIQRAALRHHLQRQSRIGHAACQRALHRHHLVADDAAGCASLVAGNAADGRPQADNATGPCRVADRAPVVVAVRDRAHACGHGRGGAATGAAGGHFGIEWIQRAAVQVVVGEPAQRERRRVTAPNDDRPCGTHVRHQRRIGLGDVVLRGNDAVGGGVAGGIDIDLDRHRHAVQRAGR